MESNDNSTASPGEQEDGQLTGLVVMTVYLALLAVFGLVGNTLVIISVVISPQLRNTSYTFIVNLSVADLSVNIIVIPVLIYSFFNSGWPKSSFWCQWVSYMFFLTTGVSLTMMMVIAASRYCLVSYSRTSYRKYCSWKGVAATVFIIIVGTSIVLVLIPVFAKVTTVHYDEGVHFCYLDSRDKKTYWYTSAVLIFGALSCFLLIPLMYYKTFRILIKSKRRLWAARGVHGRNNNNPPIVPDGRQHYMHPAEVRLTKMSALIFAIMAICWIPLWTIHFCRLGTDVPHSMQRLGIVLVLTNSSVNPYIYAWLNKRFLQAYKRILLCGRNPRVHVSQVNV